MESSSKASYTVNVIPLASCVVSDFSHGQTENPVPRSLFAPKPHGNAYYAGYSSTDFVQGESTDGILWHVAQASYSVNIYDEAQWHRYANY